MKSSTKEQVDAVNARGVETRERRGGLLTVHMRGEILLPQVPDCPPEILHPQAHPEQPLPPVPQKAPDRRSRISGTQQREATAPDGDLGRLRAEPDLVLRLTNLAPKVPGVGLGRCGKVLDRQVDRAKARGPDAASQRLRMGRWLEGLGHLDQDTMVRLGVEERDHPGQAGSRDLINQREVRCLCRREGGRNVWGLEAQVVKSLTPLLQKSGHASG